MKIYKLSHNVDYCTKATETVCVRFFSEKDAAFEVFDAIKEHINPSDDEYLCLEQIDTVIIDGEFKAAKTETVRYYSNDTKIG